METGLLETTRMLLHSEFERFVGPAPKPDEAARYGESLPPVAMP